MEIVGWWESVNEEWLKHRHLMLSTGDSLGPAVGGVRAERRYGPDAPILILFCFF